MSKPARGTKRVCLNCAARFYDLDRTRIVCPVCHSKYQVTPPPPPPRRWGRAQPAAASKVEEQKADAPVPEDAEEGTSEVGDDGAEFPAGDDDNLLEDDEQEGEADVSEIGGDKD
jgi:uncharacterized protein (TIGR02300 family)